MALPRGYISHSQIRIYSDCPRKYSFAYIEGVEAKVSDRLILGEIFHAAVERYFQAQMAGAAPAAGEAEAIFSPLFQQAAAERKVTWGTPPRETHDRGLAFFRYFIEHLAPAIRPLMVEKELSAELPGSGIVLKGVLDLVEENYCITDFKTTTGRWSESKARNATQMVIYKYLFERSFGPLPSTLKYEVLYGRHAGNIRHQTLPVSPDAGAYDRLLELVGHVAGRIEAGVFPANVTALCRFCEFCSLCRR